MQTVIENPIPSLIALAVLILWITFIYKTTLFIARVFDRYLYFHSFRKGFFLSTMLIFMTLGSWQLYEYTQGELLHLSIYFPLYFFCAALMGMCIWKDKPKKDEDIKPLPTDDVVRLQKSAYFQR